MSFERLAWIIVVTALLFAYYFAISWLARRALTSARISARTFAFVIAGRLHIPLLVLCLLSPILFGASTGAALTGVAAVGFLLSFRLVVAARSVPAVEEALANPMTTDYASWTRTEKAIVGAFVVLFSLASFALVVLLIALAPGR